MKKFHSETLNRFLSDEKRAAAILMDCTAGVMLVGLIVAVFAIVFLR